MEQSYITAKDGYLLEAHIFEARNPKAAVQIIHGMEEHQGRYEAFAAFLNENGFSVVSSDMRGHGKSAKDPGYFKDKGGYLELIEDQRAVTRLVKERFPDLPVYIFAHSMGTIITRVLLQQHSNDYEKVVLSGYPNYRKGARFGIFLANTLKAVMGAKYKSRLISSLSVGAFNKDVKNAKTSCDWISHNKKNVRSYIEDPYCGIGFTCSAFSDLFHLVVKMHNPGLYQNVNKEMPLLLLRGLDDPCTGGDKGSADSCRILSKAGFLNIRRIDYPNMRHEILQEKDCQKVYNDVENFFSMK